jgi:hypothetical protein
MVGRVHVLPADDAGGCSTWWGRELLDECSGCVRPGGEARGLGVRGRRGVPRRRGVAAAATRWARRDVADFKPFAHVWSAETQKFKTKLSKLWMPKLKSNYRRAFCVKADLCFKQPFEHERPTKMCLSWCQWIVLGCSWPHFWATSTQNFKCHQLWKVCPSRRRTTFILADFEVFKWKIWERGKSSVRAQRQQGFWPTFD